MTIALWIDATNGAAGDMLLAALLDAGADATAVHAAMTAIATATGEPLSLSTEPVRRHGLRAVHARVQCGPSAVRRGPAAIAELLQRIDIPDAARRFAAQTFITLAEAEARVHGVQVEQVHFHEVGALDSLADVIGSAVALHSLGALDPDARRVVSSVGVGSGTARTEHGPMPVPVPATLQLLTDAGALAQAGPDRTDPGELGELCTPTGAALLVTLATGWGAMPALELRRIGLGAGTADPPGHPNVVRVVIGEAGATTNGTASEAGRVRTDELYMLESTLDDLDPRLWPGTLERLQAAGAVDAWLTPVLMRHGRPGHVVTALVPADHVDPVFRRLVLDTTTLGVRLHPVQRRALPRDRVQVRLGDQPVGVKRGWLDGVVVTAQPEFTEAAAAAEQLGLPVAEVLDRARLMARTDPPAG